MRKYLNIGIALLLLGAILVLPGFVSRERAAVLCQQVHIRIADDELALQDISEVEQYLVNRFHNIVGSPMDAVPSDTMERLLRHNPYIANAEVYTDLNGQVFIDIVEEKPILRIFRPGGHSFYLSETGRLMPQKEGYVNRLPIFTGELDNLPLTGQYSDAEQYPQLQMLLELGNYLNQDAFFRDMIDQVYMDSTQDINLIPRIGRHYIVLGNTLDLQQKMENLRVFYEKGLKEGAWDRYAAISLKYKNQVVCTKR